MSSSARSSSRRAISRRRRARRSPSARDAWLSELRFPVRQRAGERQRLRFIDAACDRTRDDVRAEHADLVGYPAGEGLLKLAAGWLIERAGWKGFRDGDAGVHRLQALVLVNYGQASGEQLLALARRIQADIQARFGVELEIEPNVL